MSATLTLDDLLKIKELIEETKLEPIAAILVSSELDIPVLRANFRGSEYFLLSKREYDRLITEFCEKNIIVSTPNDPPYPLIPQLYGIPVIENNSKARMVLKYCIDSTQGAKMYEQGEPCSLGCSAHITHPCEKCGRIAVVGIGVYIPRNEQF